MELFEAHQQWANRPKDERFPNLQSMHQACLGYRQSSRTAKFDLRQCDIENDAHEVMLKGPTGAQARLTHFSFGQLCSTVGAPANYLRTLPTEMAASNLRHGLSQIADERPSSMLVHKNGSMLARCITSQIYHRIWNSDIIERLIPLQAKGWKNPPARNINFEGEDIGEHHGLYASDHDMFVFMINDQNRVDDGSEGGLGRGFFVSNSEVGQAAFKIKMFYYRFVCGNHIVWGASNVREIRVIHKGQPAQDWNRTLSLELRKYADQRTEKDAERIHVAKNYKLGNTKSEVVDTLFARRSLQIARRDLDAAYDYAITDCDVNDSSSDPRSVWGMVQGITTLSQRRPFADERMKLDAAAGRILSMAL